MTPEQRLALVGIITLIVAAYKNVDELTAHTAKLLESWGAKPVENKYHVEPVLGIVQDWAIEFDRRSPAEIADRIIAELNLEVEDAS